jgi:hypothetical protein
VDAVTHGGTGVSRMGSSMLLKISSNEGKTLLTPHACHSCSIFEMRLFIRSCQSNSIILMISLWIRVLRCYCNTYMDDSEKNQVLVQ